MSIKDDIETLSQGIGNLTSAVDCEPQEVTFWFDMKDGLREEFARINDELTKLLAKKGVRGDE